MAPCKLEIIGFNIESCLLAQEGGASRIELCDNWAEGGTTPSYALIQPARAKLAIELYVMIRPRGGDFLFSADEFEIMKQDIRRCKQLGCDGVVLGVLHKDGSVDKKRSYDLVNLAYPLGVTFHRAFDRVKDPFQSMEDIIQIGCERILTSGLQQKAIDGAGLIKQLILQADDRIIIMPGSGVNAENIVALAEKTGAVEWHSSASEFRNSGMEYTNDDLRERPEYIVVQQEAVRKMSHLLKLIPYSATIP